MTNLIAARVRGSTSSRATLRDGNERAHMRRARNTRKYIVVSFGIVPKEINDLFTCSHIVKMCFLYGVFVVLETTMRLHDGSMRVTFDILKLL